MTKKGPNASNDVMTTDLLKLIAGYIVQTDDLILRVLSITLKKLIQISLLR